MSFQPPQKNPNCHLLSKPWGPATVWQVLRGSPSQLASLCLTNPTPGGSSRTQVWGSGTVTGRRQQPLWPCCHLIKAEGGR